MKKRYIAILFTLVLCLICGAFLYSQFQALQQVEIDDEEVLNVIDVDYDLPLPANENEAREGTGEVIPRESVTTEPVNDSGKKQSNTNQKPTATEIKEKYEASFEVLEGQANERIQQLVSRAYEEYTEHKSSNETVSYSYFYGKYTSAADRLEKVTDQAFTSIYEALQEELQQHGFSVNEAALFLEQYEQSKSERKSALLKKAMENF